MTVFVVVYACRVIDGIPCPDGRGRLNKAMEVAGKISDSVIVLSAGVHPEDESGITFAEYSRQYLLGRGWPQERIVVNPAVGHNNFNTLGETEAAFEVIKGFGNGKIIGVTSWYHGFRVWMVWALRCKRLIKVKVSWITFPLTNPLRELIAIPLNLWRIFKRNRAESIINEE